MRDLPIPTPTDLPGFLNLAHRFEHNPGGLRTALLALVARGLSLDEPLDGQTPMHKALMSRHGWLVQGLLEAGADPMAQTGDEPAFRAAVAWNETQPVLVMLATGKVDLAHVSQTGSTAFHDAAINGNALLLEAMVAAGEPGTATNRAGKTALEVYESLHVAGQATPSARRARDTLMVLLRQTTANRLEQRLASAPAPPRPRL